MNYKETAKKAIEKYPDLKDIGNEKMIVFAYRFREEQLRNFTQGTMTDVADGRCLEPGHSSLGPPHYRDIDKSKPRWLRRIALNVFDECVVCRLEKKSIPICPNCWDKIRKCLELKGESHREGFVGWGYEMNLDLSPLIKLLKENGQLKKGGEKCGKF